MMKKSNFIQEQKAITIYFISMLISIVFSPLFNYFHELIYKPIPFDSLLSFHEPRIVDVMLNGGFLAYLFFLPLISFVILENYKWKIWFIGALFPLMLSVNTGIKDITWAFVFTFLGWMMAQLILFIKGKIK